MKTSYKILMLTLSLVLFTACGGGSSTGDTPTAKELAIIHIIKYAEGGATTPTLQDYLDAGVTGVTVDNLNDINEVVENLTKEEVDTTAELQALVDDLAVVMDITPPLITLLGSSEVNITVGDSYTEEGANATDETDGNITSKISITGTVDTDTVGIYTITYSVSDTAGNRAETNRTVNVVAEVPVTIITHNNTAYGIVTSPYTGKVWLDRNLGASHVCTAFNDTACYGDYYQWGRDYDGHQSSTSSTISTQASDVNSAGSSFIKGSKDWVSVDGAGTTRTANWSATDGSSICPVGFRVPTLAELKAELLDAGSAQIQNREDAFNSFLALPSAGGRSYGGGSLIVVGSGGYVWTSSVNGSYSHYVNFRSGDAGSYSSPRAYGFTVRCLRD